VALWYKGKVLLIRNSYRKALSFPGGFVAKGETEKSAAVRELREEVGIEISSSLLELQNRKTFYYECKDDTASVYTITLTEMPDITIDNREVVWAGFLSTAEALQHNLCPHIRAYLENAGEN
jgi:ADP-ribose pyrophosphatase YjhB (NUDIX family)